MSGAGAGFGSFMEGVQGGMKSVSDIKDARARRKLMQNASDEFTAELDAKDFDREHRHLPKVHRSAEDDPFLFRIMDHFGKSKGEDPASAIPDPSLDPSMDEQSFGDLADAGQTLGLPTDQYQPEDPTAGFYPVQGFADGGKPKPPEGYGDYVDDTPDPKSRKYDANSPEEIKARAARSRAQGAAPESAIPDPQVVDRSAPQASRYSRARAAVQRATALPEDAGLARRAINSGAAKAGVLAALVGTNVDAWQTPTEKYRERFGLQTNDPSALGDVGVRALGAASDLGNALTFGQAGRFYRDKQAPEAAAAPEQAVPTGPVRQAPPSAVARRSGPAAAPAAAIPDKPTAAGENIDWSKIEPADVPNMSTTDWAAHRKQMEDSYIMHGMSEADAIDKVDQQVTAMQQRGFMNFGKQALALLQTNPKAAASAARAAFQYIASTTDLEAGIVNGHVVMYTVDEDSGQRVGDPTVLTPELLSGILQQFSDPAAFAKLQMDRTESAQKDRELDQRDRLLNEATIPGAQAEAAYHTAQANAQAGGAQFKPVDLDRVRPQIADWAYGVTNDDQLAGALTTVAMARYMQGGPGTNLNAILYKLQQIAGTPEGMQKVVAAAQSVSSGR